MRFLSKFPIHIDYILAVMLMLTGAYTIYQTVQAMMMFPEYAEDYIKMILPELCMLFGGIILVLLPHKNLWRTVWLCGIILGINLLLMARTEFESYEILKDLLGPFDEYYVNVVKSFTFCILHLGCGLAMIINSVLYATDRVKSIYPMIIAIVLSLVVDYMTVSMQYQFYGSVTVDFIETVLEIYAPHMVLFGIFTLVFTSDDINWYTAKGDMWRAMNRLRTVDTIFGIHVITRDQLIVLMQNEHDCTFRLRQNKFSCIMEVRNHDGKKTLVFARNGNDSHLSAVYLDVKKILLPDTLSKSKYVDIYGEDGTHICLNIHEPKKRLMVGSRKKFENLYAPLPRFKYSVTNASLYHIVDGFGTVIIGKDKKPEDVHKLVISGTGEDRRAIVTRACGAVVVDIPIRAIVPVVDYGAYTRLYIYTDMGKYIAFKIKRPKRNQAEKPTED